MVRYCISLALAALLCTSALAGTESPDALIERVSTEVLDILQSRKAEAGTGEVHALVQEKILPHFDFTRMTALATGVGWRSATAAQQQELTAQFRDLLVRTYSASLSRYDDQKLEFQPARYSADNRKAIVRSLLQQSGGSPITIDYRMSSADAGWKIYDVVVDGVSLITSYRDAFASEVRQNGIEGLVRMLQDKNAELAAKES